MNSYVVAVSGQFGIRLPSWGRSFWQDPNDGELFLAYASGSAEVNFTTSADSGVTWSAPQFAFSVDNYFTHNNFDTEMDEDGNVHCAYRFNGSGCYTMLAKQTSGWAISGISPRGFVDVTDSDPAKGFNGMVAVYDTFSSDPSWWGGGFGAKSANIVLKDSTDEVVLFRVPDSGTFSSFPFRVTEFDTLTKPSAGPSGGFPVFTDAGGTAFTSAPSIAWSVNATGIAYAARISSNVFSLIDNFSIDGSVVTFTVATPAGSGYLGRVPFNPNMSFGRAVSDRVHPILASIDNGKFFIGWDLYTTAFESEIRGGISDNVFVRLAGSSAKTDTSTATDTFRVIGGDTIGTIPWIKAITQGAIPIPVKGVDSLFTPGTPSDISHGNEDGVHKIYFQTTDQAGQQVISRTICESQSESDNSEQTKYIFSQLTHPSSGLRNFAPAGQSQTGGSGLILNWGGFKALRHPTQPGVGVTKKDIVVTVGNGTDIANLIAWDFDKSIEATSSLKVPTWSREITLDSGVAPQFDTLRVFGPTYTGEKVAQLFDTDTSTNVSSLAGDGFVLEFDQLVSFTRVEFVRNFSTDYTVKVSGSLDDATYYPVAELVGGNLVKHSSEYDINGDTTVDLYIDPFIAKYLKFDIDHPGSRSISELRLYGFHTHTGKTTSGPSSSAKGFEEAPGIVVTEKFDSTPEGGLPPGWRTSGDWDWFVRTGGDLSKANGLPSTPPSQNGRVASGVFAGSFNGNLDISSMRTAENIPLNSSGILEKDIVIDASEVDDNGNPGRTIKFDTRYKLFGSGSLLNTPEDDSFRFFVVPEFGGPLDGELVDFYLQAPCFINVCDWSTVKTNVPPGNYTLKWIFKKGNTIPVSPYPGDEGIAFIDNVEGSTTVLPTTVFGYLKSRASETGTIYGFMPTPNSDLDGDIYGFLTGAILPNNGQINGYIFGQPQGFGQINGYMLGMKQGQIHGYMLGGEGLRSFPTGSVFGYINTPSGTISSVYGYMLPMQAANIYGYMAGNSGLFASVSGYLKAADAASEIYGIMNAGATGITQIVHGYMANKFNESIYGFIKAPSGAISSVYGYFAPQKVFFAHGYMRGLSDQTGIINSYMKAADGAGEIYGFLLSSGDPIVPSTKVINGYLFNLGATSNVLGYMNTLVSEEVYGYINGAEFVSGSINAYMSGVGFANSDINGYLAGISGNASGSINGYMIAVIAPNSQIDGYMIGFDPSDDCASHGSIPLPALPAFTIPSGNFIN